MQKRNSEEKLGRDDEDDNEDDDEDKDDDDDQDNDDTAGDADGDVTWQAIVIMATTVMAMLI